MRGVIITAATGVHSIRSRSAAVRRSRTPPLKSMNAFQHSARGIQPERQSAFGEVDLHTCGPVLQALANVPPRFCNEVLQERCTRVPGQTALWIELPFCPPMQLSSAASKRSVSALPQRF